MDFDYKLIHSRRRTVSLIIHRDGSLVVRAPKKVSKNEIEGILAKRHTWIKKYLNKILAKQPTKRQFLPEETFRYLGQCYPLQIADEYRGKINFENNVFYLSKFKVAQGKKLFIDWYAKQAAEIIFARVKHYAEVMNVKYRRVSITSAQTRWGSCSSGKTINFTWRLVLAPLNIIDSVVVHELAHLIHHNHSKAFWEEVQKFYPDYKTAKKWLKENGHTLQI